MDPIDGCSDRNHFQKVPCPTVEPAIHPSSDRPIHTANYEPVTSPTADQEQ